MAHIDPLDAADPSHAHTPGGLNHEPTDISLTGTTRAALFSMAGIAVVMALMWGAWGFFLSQAKERDPGKPPMSADDFGQRVPPTPRLQSVPTQDLREYRAQQNEKIEGLAWVDQSAGSVRIPIQAAMQLIVQRADSFADQQAKTPPDHSWAFPGAAMTERAGEPAAPSLPEHSPSPVPARGTEERPQPHTTAPSEQDKPQAPPHR